MPRARHKRPRPHRRLQPLHRCTERTELAELVIFNVVFLPEETAGLAEQRETSDNEGDDLVAQRSWQGGISRNTSAQHTACGPVPSQTHKEIVGRKSLVLSTAEAGVFGAQLRLLLRAHALRLGRSRGLALAGVSGPRPLSPRRVRLRRRLPSRHGAGGIFCVRSTVDGAGEHPALQHQRGAPSPPQRRAR